MTRHVLVLILVSAGACTDTIYYVTSTSPVPYAVPDTCVQASAAGFHEVPDDSITVRRLPDPLWPTLRDADSVIHISFGSTWWPRFWVAQTYVSEPRIDLEVGIYLSFASKPSDARVDSATAKVAAIAEAIAVRCFAADDRPSRFRTTRSW